jgi:hypothetical protein
MFGEIDCREGLTMAVDKLKYETVDAAMDVLLHIYKGDATLLGIQGILRIAAAGFYGVFGRSSPTELAVRCRCIIEASAGAGLSDVCAPHSTSAERNTACGCPIQL